MSDRRKEMRMPADKAAVIEGIPGHRYINCAVIDLSTEGACIELEPPVPSLPDRFHIVLDFYASAACRVMWRHGNRLGVAFSPEHPHCCG